MPPDVDDILTLAAWFEGRSVQDLLLSVVQRFTSDFATGPQAQAAIKAKQLYVAERGIGYSAKAPRVLRLKAKHRPGDER